MAILTIFSPYQEQKVMGQRSLRHDRAKKQPAAKIITLPKQALKVTQKKHSVLKCEMARPV
jgi:hypothetical protein